MRRSGKGSDREMEATDTFAESGSNGKIRLTQLPRGQMGEAD
jgi:hypothetical protein